MKEDTCLYFVLGLTGEQGPQGLTGNPGATGKIFHYSMLSKIILILLLIGECIVCFDSI